MKNAGKKQSPLLLTFIIASSNLPQSALEINSRKLWQMCETNKTKKVTEVTCCLGDYQSQQKRPL